MVPTQEKGLTWQEQWAVTAQPWLHKQEVSELFSTARCPSFHTLSAAGGCLFLSISKFPSPCASSKHCLSPFPPRISPGLLQPLPPRVPGSSPASHCRPHASSFSEQQLEKLLLSPPRSIPSAKVPGQGHRPQWKGSDPVEIRRLLLYCGLTPAM